MELSGVIDCDFLSTQETKSHTKALVWQLIFHLGFQLIFRKKSQNKFWPDGSSILETMGVKNTFFSLTFSCLNINHNVKERLHSERIYLVISPWSMVPQLFLSCCLLPIFLLLKQQPWKSKCNILLTHKANEFVFFLNFVDIFSCYCMF